MLSDTFFLPREGINVVVFFCCHSLGEQATMLQLGIAFAFVAILVDGASVCSPYGGDMSVPTESSVQVQLLTYPNSGDSGCTGEAVITKLQNGKASKLETATRTFSCCGGGGSTVVVQEDSNEAYTVTAGECTTFVGDADAEPVKLICEETTEIPIRLVSSVTCIVMLDSFASFLDC